jgi:hypothetical protein
MFSLPPPRHIPTLPKPEILKVSKSFLLYPGKRTLPQTCGPSAAFQICCFEFSQDPARFGTWLRMLVFVTWLRPQHRLRIGAKRIGRTSPAPGRPRLPRSRSSPAATCASSGLLLPIWKRLLNDSMTLQAAELAHRLARDAEAVCRHYVSNGCRQRRYRLVGDVADMPGRTLPDRGQRAAMVPPANALTPPRPSTATCLI